MDIFSKSILNRGFELQNIAGDIKTFLTDGWVAPKLLKRKDIFILYMLTAGKKALADSGITEEVMNELDKTRCGVLIGSAMGGMKVISESFKLQCCVTALVHEGRLVVSNAGDCRDVMGQQGVAKALTIDHRPSQQDERNRIEKLGGYVDCFHGAWRVHGSLAVSRAIGDGHLKDWVTAEPTTEVLRITEDCEFLILASDGLWSFPLIGRFCGMQSTLSHRNSDPTKASCPWDVVI